MGFSVFYLAYMHRVNSCQVVSGFCGGDAASIRVVKCVYRVFQGVNKLSHHEIHLITRVGFYMASR